MIKTYYQYKNNKLKNYIIILQIILADINALDILYTYKYEYDIMAVGNVYIKEAVLQILRLTNKCYKKEIGKHLPKEIISLKKQYKIARCYYKNFNKNKKNI